MTAFASYASPSERQEGNYEVLRHAAAAVAQFAKHPEPKPLKEVQLN